MARLVDRKWTLEEAHQTINDLNKLERDGQWDEVPAWAKQLAEETHTSVLRASRVGYEKAAVVLAEAQEDDALRIKQLVSIIRKLRYCPHACASPCPHSDRFDKAIEMLQPELRRRILND